MKKIICFLIALVVLIPTMAHAAEGTANSDAESIKSTITDYFDTQYNALSQLHIGDAEKYSVASRVMTQEASMLLQKEDTILEMKVESYKMALEDLTFDSYSYNLEYKSININGNTATVHLYEDNAIRYNENPSILSEITNNPHFFVLSKVDNEWVIIEHQNEEDYYYNTFDDMKESGISTSEICDAYIAETATVQAAQDNKTLSPNAPDIQDNSVSEYTATAVTAGTYDRDGAVSFARKYAEIEKSGGSYPSPFKIYKADCTNYISICLHKGGGIPMDKVGGTNSKWYWEKSSKANWTGAQQFRQYIYSNNGSKTKNIGIYGTHTSDASMEIGDIMSFSSLDPSNDANRWDDGRLKSTHSAIVTIATPVYSNGIIVGKVLYVCQHSYGSKGYKDVPISTLGYNKSGQKMYLHIVRYYK